MLMFLRRWPRWVAVAAACWGVLNAAVAGYWAAGGERGYLFEGRADARLPTVVEVVVALVSLAGAVAALRPRRVPLLGLCGVAFLGTFGLAIGSVGAIASGRLASPLALLYQLFCLGGAALSVGTYLAWRRRRDGRCPRCGGLDHVPDTGPLVRPAPSVAPRLVRLVAYLGMCGFLPWAGVKVVLGSGGSALGVTGEEWRANLADTEMSPPARWLASFGIDITVAAALVGALLLSALVHRWAQRLRVPRWLLLGAAWTGAPSLALYGLGLLIAGSLMLLGVVDPQGVEPFDATGAAWVLFLGGLAFAPLGLGFLVGSVSYARRTRPHCAPKLSVPADTVLRIDTRRASWVPGGD
jgi:D-alanyl-D-alanine dipeptidase